ncbi:Polyadenylate-binding protein [Dissostichus eleginoides]|uniref:Polyadenylate-binding protein n=1 Tax=Dissostichus eleginoides TaxID=100907 RepID=A0AAD9BME3_DISEL|nr:Polyadenylate-binding protein [Dissostichus eleginoides]
MDEAEDLETLGEKLYSLIYPKHKEKAGKLTGMLLELPGPVLGLMLQDKASLSAAVEKALGALQRAQEPSRVPCKEEDEVSASSDSVGEQLFELVDVFNTGHSQKITGMLLEQHKDAVLHLLSDPHLLEEQVTFALKTLKEQNMEETDVSDWSDTEDTERLGEKIFSLVEGLDPCMLMTSQLLSNHTLLQAAVQKAQAALHPRNQTLST